MQIQVNGKSVSLFGDSTLSNLIDQLALGKSKVAVELNREIIPRSNYANQVLKDGDNVEIVNAIGGG